MARENEDKSLREYVKRKKRYKRRRNIIIAMLLLIFAVVGVVYLVSLNNRKYKSYEVVNTTDISGENAVGYLGYNGAVIKYSKNGAVAIDKDGKQLWNGSYEMMDPIADTSGNYVVIADRDSKSVHIFNEKGEAGSYETLYDIVKVEISSKGIVAALMEDEKNNYIKLYQADGTELGDYVKTSVKKDGYPLDISLSMDGEKLITSYLSMSEGYLKSIVSCFNFGEVGKNKVDRFVGGWSFDEGVIIPRVTFAGNDTFCIYKNNGLIIGSMPELASINEKKNFDTQIKSILYNNEYTGAVLESENNAKQLVLYNLKGKKVLEQTINFDYTNILMAEEEIIMYNDSSCVIMKPNGKIKFKGTFEDKIQAIYPINKLDRYFLISGNKISQILLEE